VTLKPEKLVQTYLKIKERRSDIAAKYKEEDSSLSDQLDMVKQALLDYCAEQNIESVRTSEGLFYRSVKTRYWTSDWSSMYEFIMENQVPEFFDKRLNQNNVKQFLDENPDLVPKGLNVDSEYAIAVRKK
tara:strand:- start:283 stop:672 length:390 start_codon:yes stop_codon:yes gene_type:complete